jgi:hypothetical protein
MRTELGLENVSNLTPLEISLALEHFEVGEILLESGLEIKVSSNLSLPLRLATKAGNRALCEKLVVLPGVSPNAKPSDSLSAVELACQGANRDLFDFFMSVEGKATMKCLCLAAETGDEEFFHYILAVVRDAELVGPALPFERRQKLLRRIAEKGTKKMLESVMAIPNLGDALALSEPTFHESHRQPRDVFAPILIDLLDHGDSDFALQIVQSRQLPQDTPHLNDHAVYKAALFNSELDVAKAIRVQDHAKGFGWFSTEFYSALPADASEAILTFLLDDFVSPDERAIIALIETGRNRAAYFLVKKFYPEALTKQVVEVALKNAPELFASLVQNTQAHCKAKSNATSAALAAFDDLRFAKLVDLGLVDPTETFKIAIRQGRLDAFPTLASLNGFSMDYIVGCALICRSDAAMIFLRDFDQQKFDLSIKEHQELVWGRFAYTEDVGYIAEFELLTGFMSNPENRAFLHNLIQEYATRGVSRGIKAVYQLQIADFDPSFEDNATMILAFNNGHCSTVTELLNNDRVAQTTEAQDLLGIALESLQTPMAIALVQKTSTGRLSQLADILVEDTSKFAVAMMSAIVQTGRVDVKASDSKLFRMAVKFGNTKIAKMLKEDSVVTANDCEVLGYVQDQGPFEMFDFILGLPELDVNKPGFLKAVKRRGEEYMTKVAAHPSYRGDTVRSRRRFSLRREQTETEQD